jgi:hypothetical protein
MLEKLWVLEREYREGTNHGGVRVERNPDFEKVSGLFSRDGKTLTLLVPECDYVVPHNYLNLNFEI